ncbi:MAG: molybdopterin-synthase adenylyltransferase MoeB [Candidatus Omnitrophica bacterium]|nr:molybdopterin-synthase adenylyltransferase MoeB [Candidatus Omnitrophota bacterium]
MALTQEEIQRYSRHLILPEVGVEGQEKLKAAKILMIGAGGLGSPLSLYLAAAGIGTLGIVDDDVVDFSNLQRQVAHGTKDVGRPKVDSAMDSIKDINPNVKVIPIRERLTRENITRILKDYDFIIDGTDNFQTRYLVNDACVFAKKPFVYGSIYRFEGQSTVFWPGKGPCYRCLFAEPPPPDLAPSCAEGGVLGILPGLIGVIQATEAIKIILGKGDLLIGRLLLVDTMRMDFRQVKFRRNPECPVCSDHPTITELIDYDAFCGVGRGNEAPAKGASAGSDEIAGITAPELKALMDKKKDVVLLDVREETEFKICRIPGAKLIPLGQLPEFFSQLDPAKEMVVHCHHGGRSRKAIQFLKTKGFSKLTNLDGGIDAWSEHVDAAVPRY